MYNIILYQHHHAPSPPPMLPAQYFRFITVNQQSQAIHACLEYKPAMLLCSLEHQPDDVLALTAKLKTLFIPTPILACTNHHFTHQAEAFGILTLECKQFSDELMGAAICQLLGLSLEAMMEQKNKGQPKPPLIVLLT
jgi:hypothetical protein